MKVWAILVMPDRQAIMVAAPQAPRDAVGKPHWNKRKRELYILLEGSPEDVGDEALRIWEEQDAEV